jgi:hypothetical protein
MASQDLVMAEAGVRETERARLRAKVRWRLTTGYLRIKLEKLDL